jgi:hypothetical protein
MKNVKQIRALAAEMLSMDWTTSQIEKMPEFLDGQNSDFEDVINCYYGTYECSDKRALEKARSCLEALAESEDEE